MHAWAVLCVSSGCQAHCPLPSETNWAGPCTFVDWCFWGVAVDYCQGKHRTKGSVKCGITSIALLTCRGVYFINLPSILIFHPSCFHNVLIRPHHQQSLIHFYMTCSTLETNNCLKKVVDGKKVHVPCLLRGFIVLRLVE